MKKLVALTSAVATYGTLMYTGMAMAACDTSSIGTGGSGTNQAANGANCVTSGNVPTNLFGQNSVFSIVANTLIFIVGAIAVIMLIIGGLRYVLSSGNSSSVEGAKNTILYALIGIIIAILAYAAVNFVTGLFSHA